MKKLLALILSISIILCMAATTAGAYSSKNDVKAGDVVSEMAFTIEGDLEPEILVSMGLPDIESAESDKYNVVADSIKWVTKVFDSDEEWAETYFEHFIYGFSYGLKFDVSCELDISGYLGATVNGNEAEIARIDGSTVTVIFNIGRLDVPDFEVTGMPEAIIGESTSLENIKVTVEGKDDIVVVESAVLYEYDEQSQDGQPIESSDEVFQEGKRYRVEISLEYISPDDSFYCFEGDYSNLIIKVNGKELGPNDYYNGLETIGLNVDLGEAHEKQEIDTNSDDTNSDDTNSDDTNSDDTNSDDSDNSDKDNSDGDNSDKDNSDSDNSDTDTPKKPLYGDVDCNGEVKMEDVTALQKIIAKLTTHEAYGEMSKINSDCDHNDIINMVDVTMIQKFMAKLIDSLDPVE